MKKIAKDRILELIDESLNEIKLRLDSDDEVYEGDRFLFNSFKNMIGFIRSREIFNNIIKSASSMGVVDNLSFFEDEDIGNLVIQYVDDDDETNKSREIIFEPYYFHTQKFAMAVVSELIKSAMEGRPFQSRYIVRDSNKISLTGNNSSEANDPELTKAINNFGNRN